MCGPAKVACGPLLLLFIAVCQLSSHIPLSNGQNVTSTHPLLEVENLLVIERFLEVMQSFLKQHFPESTERVTIISEVSLSEPSLSEPMLSEPKLSEPKLSAPNLSEPNLSEPKLSEPSISEPKLSEPEVAFKKLPMHAKKCCGKTKTTPKPITTKRTTPNPTTEKIKISTASTKATTTTPRPTTTSSRLTAVATTTTTTEKPRQRFCFKRNCLKFKDDKGYIF